MFVINIKSVKGTNLTFNLISVSCSFSLSYEGKILSVISYFNKNMRINHLISQLERIKELSQ